MITLSNQTQQGFFNYEGTAAKAVGNYNADADGNLTNVYIDFKQDENIIGHASVNYYDSKPQYNINGNNLASMIVIAGEVETLIEELGNAFAGE